MAVGKTSANLIRALYNLSKEHNAHKRKTLLNAGLVEMIKWFSLAARKIIEGKMKLPKQTKNFMERRKDDVRKLASAMVDPEVKRIIILKPGGGGFFGGVIIRSLIRWDGNKLLRRKKKTTPKKKSKKTRKTKTMHQHKKKDPVKPRKSKKRINDKFVTKRRSKSMSPLIPTHFTPSTPSTTWRNLGMSSPVSNARRTSLSLAKFSPLRASPQQIVSPVNSEQLRILQNSPTFGRRHGMIPYMHLRDPKEFVMTHKTALPSEVLRIKKAKRELVRRVAKKRLQF